METLSTSTTPTFGLESVVSLICGAKQRRLVWRHAPAHLWTGSLRSTNRPPPSIFVSEFAIHLALVLSEGRINLNFPISAAWRDVNPSL